MGDFLAALLIIYLCICACWLFLGLIGVFGDTKYNSPWYLILYPIIPIQILYDLFKVLDKYLTQNNLKQMNLKILGKAMGFMFLPTFGVLLMLLVGFFDPIALWVFIKSNNAWAIFIRIILFAAEIALVVMMYFYYLKQAEKEEIFSSKELTFKEEISYSQDAYQHFPNRDSSYNFYKYATKDPNIVFIERIKKD